MLEITIAKKYPSDHEDEGTSEKQEEIKITLKCPSDHEDAGENCVTKKFPSGQEDLEHGCIESGLSPEEIQEVSFHHGSTFLRSFMASPYTKIDSAEIYFPLFDSQKRNRGVLYLKREIKVQFTLWSHSSPRTDN